MLPKRKQKVGVRVVTWNVHHSTTEKQLRADLKRVRTEGREPDVYLLQEFKPNNGHAKVFRDAGFELVYYSPEFSVAWKKSERFELIRVVEWEGEHEYWAEPRALHVVLWDTEADCPVWFLTDHPPAHVQRKDHGKWPNIWDALDETDEMWDRKARRAAKHGIPFIAGGDENVDLKKGWFPDFFKRLLVGAARPVDPDEPTHHRRTIDRFRINRLVRVVRGSKRVIKGLTSDHDAFVCDFVMLVPKRRK